MSIKTKIITTSKTKILVVSYPFHEDDFKELETICIIKPMFTDFNSFGYRLQWNIIADDEPPITLIDLKGLDGQFGNWQLLGRLSELSEEQLGMIIPTNTKAFNWKYVFPYYLSKNKTFCSTIKESFLSLLKANDVTLENKYGDGKHLETMPDGLRMFLCKEDADTLNEMWQSEQEKVFTNPILFIEK